MTVTHHMFGTLSEGRRAQEMLRRSQREHWSEVRPSWDRHWTRLRTQPAWELNEGEKLVRHHSVGQQESLHTKEKRREQSIERTCFRELSRHARATAVVASKSKQVLTERTDRGGGII